VTKLSSAAAIVPAMLTRRSLLGGALAALPLSVLWRRTSRAAAGFGPLRPDPAGILDLPEGFSYRVLDAVRVNGQRQRLTDGYLLPGAPDGMACVAGPDGTLILLRNHELGTGGDGPYDAEHPAPPEAYDSAALGGVTRVVVDATTYERISSNLVLAGTIRNCAGGLYPDGWLSCEETFSAGHGYVFECAATATAVQVPRRIVGYGRFSHEAAAVDPDSQICYLTEDEGNSCFYRFKPTSPANRHVGTLQALRVVGRDRLNTSTGMTVGAPVAVSWVDIDNPEPTGAQPTCRAQGQDRGAAIVVRGEGLWIHDGAVYFVSTTGGPVAGGQIFRLDPDGDGGTLTLLAQSTDRDQLDMPDNLTVAPWGDVYLAEDGGGEQYLRILHPDGSITDFARNARSNGELAGVCFSPDGKALFVNMQADGLTLVVTGPFPVLPPPEPDAGAPDAGQPDAGSADAGAPDAGSVDAGRPDAGVPGTPDAGDGTPGDDDGEGGCSTGSPAGAATAALVAAAALALRE
jgi:secreted PhoX family phosphatase